MKKGCLAICALLVAAEMLSGGQLSAAAAERLQRSVESGELAALTLSLELGSREAVMAEADRPPEPSAHVPSDR